MKRYDKIKKLYNYYHQGKTNLSDRTKSEIKPAFSYCSSDVAPENNYFDDTNWQDSVILNLRSHLCNMVDNNLGNIKYYYINDDNVMVF